MGQRRNKKFKKYFKANENGTKTYQNLWDTAKAVLKGKFIAINVYLKKQVSNKQPSFTPQETRKRKTNEAQR